MMPHGGIMVTESEGAANFAGSIDPVTTDDLNNRCLELVDQWTNHATFEQRLRGIGRQLLDAIKLGAPDLIKHLTAVSDHQQIVFVTNSEGLKIPFELLTLDRPNLAIDAAVSRSLMNCRLPQEVRAPFHQLLVSLSDTNQKLRVLLVDSDPDSTISVAAEELIAVKSHIEAGCRSLSLEVEFEEIAEQDATIRNVERALVDNRPFHLWHFTGHGRHFSEDPDASGIVLIGNDGAPEIVQCKRLNRWLKGTGLWLAYLSSCNTSAASGSARGLSPRYVGTMEAVVDAGVPSVVGFRWSVSDQSAFYLADEFYRQLFEVQTEKNLSLAMLEARRSVERRTDCFDAWASSMLITQYP
jgi:CHAT domain-containing protein